MSRSCWLLAGCIVWGLAVVTPASEAAPARPLAGAGKPLASQTVAPTHRMIKPLAGVSRPVKPPSTIASTSARLASPKARVAQSRREAKAHERLARLIAPFPRSTLTSHYGIRLNPVLKALRIHRGVDFGVPIGTPVPAAHGGVIAAIGRERGAGLIVRINHGDGVSTGYFHLSKVTPGLKEGSVVRTGDIVGRVGKSGYATGPNLHYEVMVNGKQVDPLMIQTTSEPIRIARQP